jgi:hypothetical protein
MLDLFLTYKADPLMPPVDTVNQVTQPPALAVNFKMATDENLDRVMEVFLQHDPEIIQKFQVEECNFLHYCIGNICLELSPTKINFLKRHFNLNTNEPLG